MWLKRLVNGIFRENPILILMIGLCPVLACSSTATDALGMGAAVTFVLACSNLMVSLIRKWVPGDVRIPVFIIIIATFVTIVDYSMQAYLPSLSTSLGVFVPLIVVNCIILGRAEAFAYRNTMWASLWDAFGMGIGFTLAITLLGVIREVLGAGTLFKSPAFFSQPATLMILPPGAFIGIGVLISVWKLLNRRAATGVHPCSHCGLATMCHPTSTDRCEAVERLDAEDAAESGEDKR